MTQTKSKKPTTPCDYDGMTQVDNKNRCTFCGNTRRQAKLAVKQWERDYPQYTMPPFCRQKSLVRERYRPLV